ncbi:MAG: acyltransferase [Magnetospirillum sp.]|nr:acyltransferase [Magnetospirillum sp.]
MHAPNFHPSYRPDIDGLRAVAVVSVVLHHSFLSAMPGGFVGVDIFFVISGFLISTIIFKTLETGSFSFLNFYVHRVNRIFPALVLMLAATYVIGWFALLPDEYMQLGKHMAAGAGFAQNLALASEAGYFDGPSELKPLMHLWSLAIEEQFYLAYPLLVWTVWRLRANLLAVVTVVALASLALNLANVGSDPVRTFFFPDTRAWELATGALLAGLCLARPGPIGDRLKRRVFALQLGDVISVLGLLMIAASAFGFSRDSLFPGWRAIPPVAGAGLLILAGPDAWVNRKLLARKVMVGIGLISYPLYLWHWPLLAYTRIAEFGLPPREVRAAAVVLSVLLAGLTYALVERPIRFGRQTALKPVILCLLVGLLGAGGGMTWRGDGFAFRTAEITRNSRQFEWKFDVSPDCQPIAELAGQTYCIGAAESPSIILVGDSHGDALYPGMADLAERVGERVLVFSRNGCLPFFDVASFQRGKGDACVEYANAALTFAEGSRSAKTIVLVARGPLYLTGKGYGDGERFLDRVIALKGRPEVSDFREVFTVGLRSTLERLTKSGKRIVFVIDVPEISFNPKSCVNLRPVRLTAGVKSPCAMPMEEFRARNREYRELVASVLKDFPSVVAFDAAASLCDGQSCWAMRDGEVLYRDPSHITVEGSRLVARHLMPLAR